jgi:hypothetical protein
MSTIGTNTYGEYLGVGLTNVQQAAHDANAMAAFVKQYGGIVTALRKLQASVENLEAKNLIGDTLIGVGDALDEGLYIAQQHADEYLAECEAEAGEDRVRDEMFPPMLNPATGHYERVNLISHAAE